MKLVNPKNVIFFLCPGLDWGYSCIGWWPTVGEKSFDNHSNNSWHKKYLNSIEQSTVKCSGFRTVRAYSILVFYKGGCTWHSVRPRRHFVFLMKTTVNDGGNNIRRRSIRRCQKLSDGNKKWTFGWPFFFVFSSSLLYQRRVHSLIHVCAGVMLSVGEVEILQASVREVRSIFVMFFFLSFDPLCSLCFQKKSVAAGEWDDGVRCVWGLC